MQHADDIPARRNLLWRVVVPTVVLVLLGVGAGIVWQLVREERAGAVNGHIPAPPPPPPVTNP